MRSAASFHGARVPDGNETAPERTCLACVRELFERIKTAAVLDLKVKGFAADQEEPEAR